MEQSFQIPCGMMQVACKLSEPVGAVRRVVLSVHGFAGSMEDEIQQGIAEELPLFGAAVLRFDFPAHGESPVTDKDLNLRSCIDSLLTAARFLRERYEEAGELCIFATGFGAYVTLIALDALIESIDSFYEM